ncbi:heat shock protein 90kDa beta [Strigomonas culicis]|uniref:Heat shock protein 90kDa beta n=1 Tax=Strigomonas culicis TaxID=28005 RepID=S9U4L8_9TRYP|nr:heat shock protein 90kDa beta [Strigomonas culicis]EPY25717.1 heat shock protein 90kDa beta [Strigomonas culicis]|eukprot:EPY21226.1 heat shock protein 90kDa beta [Strigomonas culicis]
MARLNKTVKVVLQIALVVCLLLGATVAKETTEQVAKGEPTTFTAEVSKMLDILINSLYTNRAIFLRELISNGSDALDKVRVLYLTDPKNPVNKDGEPVTMDIHISIDKEQKQLIIRDGGIGMTKEDLSKNLGSLGTSGTKRFLEGMKSGATSGDSSNLIGQFGVGFYSVFLVAKRVIVASKHDSSDVQYVWESHGDGRFFLYEDPRGNTLGRGTELRIELKPDSIEYLNMDRIKETIHQYSEFIDFPIHVQEQMAEDEVVKELQAQGMVPEEVEAASKEPMYRWTLVNKNRPIWTRSFDEVKEADYDSFYKALTHDYREPLYYSHFKVEGEVEFDSILFIPTEASEEELDSTQRTKNIKLYVRRVFITDDFKDLLPRYLSFVKGVVDSNDLPLNVSRELLQESRVLQVIKKKLVRKALAMFADIQAQDDRIAVLKKEGREVETDAPNKGVRVLTKPTYKTFWELFGRHLRYGVVSDPNNRGRLLKLLRYRSSMSRGKYVTLKEYTDRMKKGQRGIYYLTGDSIELIERSPLLQDAKKRGIEVLYMTDTIDEYVVNNVPDFAGKKLINIAAADADYEEDDDRQRALRQKREERFEPLFSLLRQLFGEKEVKKIVLTKRHTDLPFLLTNDENHMSIRMQKLMRSQMTGSTSSMLRAQRVLEVNYRHPLVDELYRRFIVDPNDNIAEDIAWVLFDTANMQAEFPVLDVAAYSQRVVRLLATSVDLDPDQPLMAEDNGEAEEEETEDL